MSTREEIQSAFLWLVEQETNPELDPAFITPASELIEVLGQRSYDIIVNGCAVANRNYQPVRSAS